MKILRIKVNQFQKCILLFLIVFSILYPAYSSAKISAGSAVRFTPSNDTSAYTNISPIQDSVMAVAAKMPEYPGGNDAKLKFLAGKLRYPNIAKDKNQQGRVIVQFVVSKTGKVKNAKVVKSIAPALDKEALRLVNSLPDWIPGEENGQKVSVYQIVVVTFKLADQFSKLQNPKVIAIDNIKMPLNFDINILKPSEIDTGYATMPTTDEMKRRLINKYGIEAENGVIEVYTNRFKELKNKVRNEPWDTIERINPDDKNAIYPIIDIDKLPEFNGGNKNFVSFINKNLKYPVVCKEKGIQGNVIVQFVIDKTGKVKDAVVKNKIHILLATEAIRVVNSLPDWIPGEKHGEKVNVRYTLPIQFKINGLYPQENDSTTDTNLLSDRQLVVLDGNILPYGFDANWLNFPDIQTYKLLVPKNKDEEKEFKLRFGPNSTKGVFIAISKKYFSDKIKDRNGNIIYDVVEQMPQFAGGEANLNRIIEKNLIYPPSSKRKGIQGKVIIQFVVNSTGQVERYEILRGLDLECDNEALRIFKFLQTWIPGKQAGENVSVWYTLPITFKLQ